MWENKIPLVEVVIKVLHICNAMYSRKEFCGAYWKCGSISFCDLAAAKIIKFTAVECKPNGTRFFFSSPTCLNVKGDVSVPVFIQVAKSYISGVAPYGICRFFDGNP
jgi:hypothetical protein